MTVYQTQVNTTEPDNWRKVSARDYESAAITALRVAKPLPEFPCTVYVGDLKVRSHANGAPLCVHAFTIERAKETS